MTLSIHSALELILDGFDEDLKGDWLGSNIQALESHFPGISSIDKSNIPMVKEYLDKLTNFQRTSRTGKSIHIQGLDNILPKFTFTSDRRPLFTPLDCYQTGCVEGLQLLGELDYYARLYQV